MHRIVFCKNGHQLTIDDTAVGRTIQCPSCDDAVEILSTDQQLASNHLGHRRLAVALATVMAIAGASVFLAMFVFYRGAAVDNGTALQRRATENQDSAAAGGAGPAPEITKPEIAASTLSEPPEKQFRDIPASASPAEAGAVPNRVTGTFQTPPPNSSRDLLSRLKAAAVYIKVETSQGRHTGSGFLLRRSETMGLVATNSHVITADGGEVKSIKCVLHSGEANEQEIEARVIGRDDLTDLAILAIRGRNLPNPVEMSTESGVQETDTVLVLGFPFGKTLASGRGNPEISVTKGIVSSIRRNDFGNVVLLQVDGAINPGNSGGPVVTESGQLIGVSVSKIVGSDIGFAIPYHVLQDAFMGRVAGIRVRKVGQNAKGNDFRIGAIMMDPERKLLSAQAIVFRVQDQTVTRPGSDGRWPQAATELVRTVELPVDSLESSTRLLLNPRQTDLMLQVTWERDDGSKYFSHPIPIQDADQVSFTSRSQSGTKIDGNLELILLSNNVSHVALDPLTGDLACLELGENRLVLLRKDALDDGDLTEPPSVFLPGMPSDIVFKRFAGKSYFAVAIPSEKALFLIDARTVEVSHRIPVSTSYLHRLAASANLDDPWIYYTYTAGQTACTGAVDVSSMENRELILRDTNGLELSPSGRTAYGVHSSDLTFYERVNDFDEEAPVFEPGLTARAYDSGVQFSPDGQMVASHMQVYSPDLSQSLTKLPGKPIAFFQSKPIILVLKDTSFRFISANTMREIGEPYAPPRILVAVSPNAISYSVDLEVINDEPRRRLLCVLANRIGIIPYSELSIPEEPPMRWEISDADFVVGQHKSIQLRTTNPAVSIARVGLSDGMARDKNGFHWTPKHSDVGFKKIPIELQYEDIWRRDEITLTIAQPSSLLPEPVTGIAVDETSQQLVCWSIKDPAPRQQVVQMNRSFLSTAKLSGELIHHEEFRNNITDVILTGDNVAVVFEDDKSVVRVYEAKTLARVKSLLASTPVIGLDCNEESLLVRRSESVDLYDRRTLKFERSLTVPPAESNNDALVLLDGILQGGLLVDEQGNRKLITYCQDLKVLTRKNRPSPERLLRGYVIAIQRHKSSPGSVGQSVVAGPLPVTKLNTNVTLISKLSMTKMHEHQIYSTRKIRELALEFTNRDGEPLADILVCREVRDGHASKFYPLSMDVTSEAIYVASGRRVFRVALDSINVPAEPSVDEDELYFKPVQSSFLVSDTLTDLTHELIGGKGPYEFVLDGEVQGMVLDRTTGELQLDRDKVIAEFGGQLTQFVRSHPERKDAIENLRLRSDRFAEITVSLTGRRPEGLPLALPVHVRGSDAEGNTAELQYYVILDAPVEIVADAALDKL